MKSGYRLVGYDSSTTYKTLSKALKACSKSDTCKGVTREARSRYRTNNDCSPIKRSGMIAYLKGNKWALHNKIYYSYVDGIKFKTNLSSKTYTSRAKGATACKSKSSCSGMTYNSSTKKYTLGKGYSFEPSANDAVWIRGGVKPTVYSMSLTYGGYTWSFKQPYKLSGYVNSTKYTSRNKALKVNHFCF